MLQEAMLPSLVTFRMYVSCVAVLALWGCASAPVQRDIQRASLVEGADFDSTWAAVVQVFAERTWSIDNLERDSGIITTDWMMTDALSDAYMDCGSAGLLGSHGEHADASDAV